MKCKQKLKKGPKSYHKKTVWSYQGVCMFIVWSCRYKELVRQDIESFPCKINNL